MHGIPLKLDDATLGHSVVLALHCDRVMPNAYIIRCIFSRIGVTYHEPIAFVGEHFFASLLKAIDKAVVESLVFK
ncbi:MAG: hypothetical protein ACI9JK_000331 [Phycisphaerales bacterium]|jgi:hypothetical protein